MPTLADIYSAADSFKRRLSDAAMNPGATLQQMLGYANDRARVLNEMTSAAAQEKDLYGPATQRLGQKLADAYNPAGMVVYHGSPHLFEKFDLSKMGTGEGQQVYGKGLYMAENPDVARKYAVDVASKDPKNVFAKRSNVNQDAINYFEAMLRGEVPRDVKNNVEVSDDYIKSQISQLQKQLPSFYKVDLPDTHVRRMLDFDAPLKNQPKQVRELAKSLGMDMNDLGGDLVARVGKGEEGKQILEKAGIRGIKYFDQMSRGDQTGTRNFVVFNPEHLTILERNAEKLK